MNYDFENKTILIASSILMLSILSVIIPIQVNSKKTKAESSITKQKTIDIQSIKNGKTLFRSENCISCHKIKDYILIY